MVTLTNDFHRTSATVRANAGDKISARTERRLWRALCGYSECICGGFGGARGGEYWLDPDLDLTQFTVRLRKGA